MVFLILKDKKIYRLYVVYKGDWCFCGDSYIGEMVRWWEMCRCDFMNILIVVVVLILFVI